MQVVQDSAEHHFLTWVEGIKASPGGWIGIHIAFARKIDHDTLMSDLPGMAGKLEELDAESARTLADLGRKVESFADATVYRFADNDILLIFRPVDQSSHDAFYRLFKELSATIRSGLVDFIDFGRDIMEVQKLADRKLLAGQRMRAYKNLKDANRVASIAVRRQRRAHAVIQIVEDDRFTATYTTNILNKDYDVVHSRTGEDAMIDYIEHAPDIVFLDIHLPGLDGLETLHALRQADADAHVIILSVDTVRSNITIATNRGAAGFLKKPFSKERIQAIVEKSPFIRGSKSLYNRA